MQEGGFNLREADPTMLYKEDEKGVCIIVIYIDDMLIIGKEEANKYGVILQMTRTQDTVSMDT